MGLAVAQGYLRDQPIAVAAVAVLAYAAVLGSAFREDRGARIAGAATALAGVLFGVYLLAAQLANDALCPWCLATDLVIDALAVAALLRLAEKPDVGVRIGREVAGRGRPYLR